MLECICFHRTSFPQCLLSVFSLVPHHVIRHNAQLKHLLLKTEGGAISGGVLRSNVICFGYTCAMVLHFWLQGLFMFEQLEL